ncbi:MAG: ImmA/IrrE family metallo-endopeptidase [Candidatus Nitronauta litoralis]|uniref:ImmA/IrrE family metallo-endopeptidase n=1 Tax=Candidatus Nitronauta litoralis TaxID=2705533 RepID=A0A7T0G078_9BACT|nr:MAG: ImmA/IrrE family metallo-endopeptidase [Candidatus Nitronauta litoralis]
MPKINHIILSWARETAELSLEEAANKLGIRDGKKMRAQEKLLAYEDGTAEPSRSMLLKFSKIYRRPLLTFYLNNPPSIGDRGEDFRSLPDDFESEENVYVDVLIRDIKASQSVIRETLIDEDENIRLDFVGKNTTEQGIQRVTNDLQVVLNLDMGEFRAQSNHGNAFKLLRHAAEKIGVIVLLKGNLGSHHTNISVKAFRGFALSDDIAPFVVINDRDAESAWAFTLLHELTHILLGQTGVSGAFAKKQIEKFCNEVASEFLLPKDVFKNFQVSASNFEGLEEQISQYAFSQKISSTHISYRLFRRGDIDKKTWEQLRDSYHKKWVSQRDKKKAKNREQKGGPDYYVVRRHKLGALVGLVQRLNYSGALSTTKAGFLLDVRPLKVHRLFEASNNLT